MRKSFTRFLVIVIMIVTSVLALSNNNEISANNSSPPAQRKIAVEMNALANFTPVVLDENRQIPLTVMEELAVKKYDAPFGIITMLQTTNIKSCPVVLSNEITSMEPIAAMILMRDGQGRHILKHPTFGLLNSTADSYFFANELKSQRNCANWIIRSSSQQSVVEGLRINEKVAINSANLTGKKC